MGILDVRDGDRGVRHPVIDDRRSGAVPGGSVCVYAAVSNRCCQLVGQFGNRRPRPRTPSPSPSTESTPASKLFFYYKDTLTQPTKTNFLRPRFAALRPSSGKLADMLIERVTKTKSWRVCLSAEKWLIDHCGS